MKPGVCACVCGGGGGWGVFRCIAHVRRKIGRKLGRMGLHV
jgi:hypothetical protein